MATELGIQFCDQAGRVNGIISKPQRAWLANLTFAGPDFNELYATCADKVFKRKVKVTGYHGFQAPLKPRAPGL